MAKPNFDSYDTLDHLLSEEAMMGMLNIGMMKSKRMELGTCQQLREAEDWTWLDELQNIGLAQVDLTAVDGRTVVCAELTPAGKALLAHFNYGMRGSKLEKEARKK